MVESSSDTEVQFKVLQFDAIKEYVHKHVPLYEDVSGNVLHSVVAVVNDLKEFQWRIEGLEK